jgi:hypothetical protein
MGSENVDLTHTPIPASPGDLHLPYLARIASALESIVETQRRLADAVDPASEKIVDSRYVADKLGLKTTQAIRDQIKAGRIPQSCIVSGSGEGRLWKFHRDRIDEWIAQN